MITRRSTLSRAAELLATAALFGAWSSGCGGGNSFSEDIDSGDAVPDFANERSEDDSPEVYRRESSVRFPEPRRDDANRLYRYPLSLSGNGVVYVSEYDDISAEKRRIYRYEDWGRSRAGRVLDLDRASVVGVSPDATTLYTRNDRGGGITAYSDSGELLFVAAMPVVPDASAQYPEPTLGFVDESFLYLHDHYGRWLFRIEAATGRLVATIPLPFARPEPRESKVALAVRDGEIHFAYSKPYNYEDPAQIIVADWEGTQIRTVLLQGLPGVEALSPVRQPWTVDQISGFALDSAGNSYVRTSRNTGLNGDPEIHYKFSPSGEPRTKILHAGRMILPVSADAFYILYGGVQRYQRVS